MLLKNNISKASLNIQKSIAIAGSVFIVLGVSCGAFFRYVLGISFHGLEELLVIASFWLYFSGASYASYKNKHIRAEVFSIYYTQPTLRHLVAIFASLITTSLSILYSFWGWEFLIWSIDAGGQTTRLQIPLAIGHSAVFFGFSLMSCYFLLELLQKAKEFYYLKK